MNARDHRCSRVAAAALCLAILTLPSVLRAGSSWVPLGPDLINNGQAWPGRVPVTGRINVVVPNPENPVRDIWIGSATGGVWNGSIGSNNFWKPMTDQAESLAVGSIALDNCSKFGCGTVWVGTGENSIRRDTQYGQGVLKGQWNSSLNVYEWTLLGKDKFTRGNITKIVLDPTTSGSGKVLFAALSTGQTSNGSHSTVTTEPPGPLGVWRSTNGGLMWSNVLSQKTPATDLEMDPQDHKILFAGLRHKGLARSLDGGDTWQEIGYGIPAGVLSSADWPEIAVFRTPDMEAAILYTVLGACPHPHDKGDAKFCSPAIYASDDGGDHWFLMHAEASPLPAYGEPLTSYASYTHALTIHPTDPYTLWYGGINLYKSTTGGIVWEKIGNKGLHPDHHQVVVFPWKKAQGGIVLYDVNDGGFFVSNTEGEYWSGNLQQGLAVTQFQSVSATLPSKKSFILGGTQDNGTNFYQNTKVWKHADDGDSASTLIDSDDPRTTYDVYVGATPRRCTKDDPCGNGAIGWPDITGGLPGTADVSWYPPMAQGTAAVEGQHALYIGTTELYNSLNDGSHWSPMGGALPWPPGGPLKIKALNDIRNPISAIAVAPSNPDRIYIGFYGGQVFTTVLPASGDPVWTALSTGLPGRPVTSLAVHPADDKTVFAAFAGFGTHSVYRSTAGGTWGPLDDSVQGDLSSGSVNTLTIERVAPYAVWAGTDDGIYSREDADSLLSVWYRNEQGLPNVAVYDLEIVGGLLYAATHGRGVWRLSLVGDGSDPWPDFYFEECCGYIDLFDPQPFISMSVAGFEPLQRCSVSLYEGSRLCSTSGLDADGATLTTDGYGGLGVPGWLVRRRRGVLALRGQRDRGLLWRTLGQVGGEQGSGGAAAGQHAARLRAHGPRRLLHPDADAEEEWRPLDAPVLGVGEIPGGRRRRAGARPCGGRGELRRALPGGGRECGPHRLVLSGHAGGRGAGALPAFALGPRADGSPARHRGDRYRPRGPHGRLLRRSGAGKPGHAPAQALRRGGRGAGGGDGELAAGHLHLHRGHRRRRYGGDRGRGVAAGLSRPAGPVRPRRDRHRLRAAAERPRRPPRRRRAALRPRPAGHGDQHGRGARLHDRQRPVGFTTLTPLSRSSGGEGFFSVEDKDSAPESK
jgi:hypothetical protein